jgi:toxin ParE1/3/4
MARYRLSAAAEADIIDVLEWSETRFGPTARIRYEYLLLTALGDIAADPLRPGSLTRPELGSEVRSWHLRASRDRAGGPAGIVQRPRHFLIYRPVEADLIVIGRVLHDAMELERHIQNPALWD